MNFQRANSLSTTARLALSTTIATCLLFISIGCDTKVPDDSSPNGVVETKTRKKQMYSSGKINDRTLDLPDGTKAQYSVWVPKDYKKNKPAPLVLALHYGGKGEFYGRGIIDVLVRPALEPLGAIIVAPSSVEGGWTSYQNEIALPLVLQQVKRDFEIDDNRTLITGFSMGGHGTWNYGAKHQSEFSAAIPIAGTPTFKTEWDTPLYVIHSNKDTVVDIGPTREFVDKLKSEGSDVTFIELNDLTHFQTNLYAGPLSKAVPWVEQIWESHKTSE